MDLEKLISELSKKHDELYEGVGFEWRHPDKAPENPENPKFRNDWPKWDHEKRSALLKKEKANWFYAEVEIPKRKCGFNMAGEDALFEINGWVPFTLWIDGIEIFKEEHVWYATGPIFEPVKVEIRPGKKYLLAFCTVPTELSSATGPGLSVRIRPCVETAVEIEAVILQLRIANQLAKTDSEKATLGRAISCIDVRALNSNDWGRFGKSVAKMESVLSPFSKRAKEMTIHLIGHSHIDMDWMWTWKDTVNCVRRDFKAVTDLMDEYPDLTFTHSQIPTYQVAKDMDPVIFEKIKKRMKEGTWENGAATWVECDLSMADGEALARHLLYAGDWSEKNLCVRPKVFWAPDTFSHPGNMPQIAKLGGQSAYFHMRCNPGADNNWPFRQWEGIDGTRILTFSKWYNGTIYPLTLWQGILDSMKFGYKNVMHIWGIGDHGGALCKYQLHLLSMYRNKPLIPVIKFGTISKLADALRNEKAKLPANRGETFPLFEGCFTTHSLAKKYNRFCENALLSSESLCAIAGINRNDELGEAWKKSIFNHFHDLICGAAANDSYMNVYKRSQSALNTAKKAEKEAMSKLAKTSANGRTLVVFNPTGFERTEPVRTVLLKNAGFLVDDNGKEIPVQKINANEFVFIAESVPAFSKKSYKVVCGRKSDKTFGNIFVSDKELLFSAWSDYFKVETKNAIIYVSKVSGVIGSYYDKILKKEFVSYGIPHYLSHTDVTRQDLAMNLFQVIDENPNGMAHWLIDDIRREENLLKAESVRPIDAGPVFAKFRITHKFRSSSIEEDVVFYNELSRTDFEVKVDWKEKGNAKTIVPQLKLSFAGTLKGPRARFSGPFCVTERPADGQEQPTQKWVDVTGDGAGFTVYNDSKYGADVLGCRVRMTLLRDSFRGRFGSDNGIHTMKFSFCPHGSKTSCAEFEKNGVAFNRKLTALLSNERAGKYRTNLVMEGSGSVVCTSLRNAENSKGVVVRLFECDGKRAKIKFALGRKIKSATEINFLEEHTGKVKMTGGKISAGFRPYEIKSFLVDCEF